MDFENYDIVKGFGQVADGYDRSNDAMTMGLHRRWRRNLCREVVRQAPPNSRWLDVATGTGDVLLGVLRERTDLLAVGVDPTGRMLELAQEKLAKRQTRPDARVSLSGGDCLRLPFPDGSFDTVTISWGIRNVRPFREGLAEIRRVLKPGGRLLVLESGAPQSPVIRAFYSVYKRALPWIGEATAGYRPTFEYYWRSVDRFPAGPNFVAELDQAGYAETWYKAQLGGICYLYGAVRPVL